MYHRTLILTLSVGHAPTQGFKLEFYSSGSPQNSDLSGHALLTEAKGNYTYPVNGGQYGNNENALFAIAPSVPGQPTLRFSRVDLENDSGCMRDPVRIFNWFDNGYLEVARWDNFQFSLNSSFSSLVFICEYEYLQLTLCVSPHLHKFYYSHLRRHTLTLKNMQMWWPLQKILLYIFDFFYRFCGSTIPTSVTFQDGAGLILFVTDASLTATGFEFQYE